MLKIHKQTLAEQDLFHIWLYTFENWGEVQADKYHNELSRSFEVIADNPEIGMRCDDIRQGYFKYHVNEHLIFYRISGDAIHIIRVLGDEMDYQQHL